MHIKRGIPQLPFLPLPPQGSTGPEELGARQQELLDRMRRLRRAGEIRRRNKRDKRRSPREVEEDLPESDFEQALVDAYDRLTRR
jgi:hypothetical protein